MIRWERMIAVLSYARRWRPVPSSACASWLGRSRVPTCPMAVNCPTADLPDLDLPDLAPPPSATGPVSFVTCGSSPTLGRGLGSASALAETPRTNALSSRPRPRQPSSCAGSAPSSASAPAAALREALREEGDGPWALCATSSGAGRRWPSSHGSSAVPRTSATGANTLPAARPRRIRSCTA